jgi:hypothetical protein
MGVDEPIRQVMSADHQSCSGFHKSRDGGFSTMSIEVLSSCCMCTKTVLRFG